MKTIPLSQNKVTLVDDEDYPKLMESKWFNNKTRNACYAARNPEMVNGTRGSFIYMHNVIMNPPGGMEIDHINGDGLDNQRGNLRVVTHRENLQNYHKSGKTSQYPGVRWDKGSEKWRANIRVKGRLWHLGLFEDELEAATAYRVACAMVIESPCLRRAFSVSGLYCPEEMPENGGQ